VPSRTPTSLTDGAAPANEGMHQTAGEAVVQRPAGAGSDLTLCRPEGPQVMPRRKLGGTQSRFARVTCNTTFALPTTIFEC
jgi:hypothetical protein